MSARKLAIARRKAMSQSGKQALGAQGKSNVSSDAVVQTAPVRKQTATTTKAARSRPVVSTASSAREASLARRRAMSTRGKVAIQSKDRIRLGNQKKIASPVETEAKSVAKNEGCGCGGKSRSSRPSKASRPRASRATASDNTRASKRNNLSVQKAKASISPGRAASLARRRAQSERGKGGISKSGMTQAQTVRSTNPDLSSRDLAKILRTQRSKRGGVNQRKSAPTGRVRPKRAKPNEQGPAKDQPWKVGITETAQGQQVSGTMVGRSQSMTGDEASTCRAVTGTEYMGADVFRDFCQIEPAQPVKKVALSPTSHGNMVSGNKVGRSGKVTGDEPGTCKNVTGTEYLSADQSEAWCGVKPQAGPAKIAMGETNKGQSVTGNMVLRSDNVTGNETGFNRQLTGTQYTQLGEVGNVPAKVNVSKTMTGRSVTGPVLNRREKMTGDEAGSCRNVTGDEYVSQEQFQSICQTEPVIQDEKVGRSRTLNGENVTGTMTGRSSKVTGDEPGTCKAVTGTPYAGVEQYGSFCEAPQAQFAAARMHASKRVAGAPMTGLQPGVGGKMTGDGKGACENVSGTAYIGADQQGAICPSQPAESNSSDFPQAMSEQPWGKFSTTPPNHAVHGQSGGNVTGTAGYEHGHITGPFGMAAGVVTGTEQARFGDPVQKPSAPVVPEVQPEINGRVKSRISGEGLDSGRSITGDAWDRGDQVTGTEGMSATRRNETRRGGDMTPMVQMRIGNSRNEELPTPVSLVTGSSGNTEKGSLITYSGGARG